MAILWIHHLHRRATCQAKESATSHQPQWNRHPQLQFTGTLLIRLILQKKDVIAKYIWREISNWAIDENKSFRFTAGPLVKPLKLVFYTPHVRCGIFYIINSRFCEAKATLWLHKIDC